MIIKKTSEVINKLNDITNLAEKTEACLENIIDRFDRGQLTKAGIINEINGFIMPSLRTLQKRIEEVMEGE